MSTLLDFHGAEYALYVKGFMEYLTKEEYSPGYYYFSENSKISFTLKNFFHPFVGDLIEKLNKESLKGMFDPKFLEKLGNEFVFDAYYNYSKDLAQSHFQFEPFPKKEIDLSTEGPYANYNWELFYHIPVAVAIHLSNNQRFAEAQKWFHLIFDPTNNNITEDPAENRFWRFIGFRAGKDITQVDELILQLYDPNSSLREDIEAGYKEIRKNPFKPHVVARTRHVAYQYYIVMKYLDNLIAWGDNLFRQDTIESINEATQCYIMAANILGKHPDKIPQYLKPRSYNYEELRKIGESQNDILGNALIELEGLFPMNLSIPEESDEENTGPLFGIGRTLYFCVPGNEKMLTYWNIVGDRLFKIRHCMNIEGVVRQLALFDPPLDPGMLAKAAAAGISIGSIVAGANQPVGPIRSLFLIQKALELCTEVRGLGTALLSAIEKGDSEHIALLRQGHEMKIQEMQQDLRFLQWKQAQESTETLLKSRANALERYRYYHRVLGLTPDNDAVPDSFKFERKELTEENFDEIYSTLVEQFDRNIPKIDFPTLKLKKEGKLYLSEGEYADLNDHADRALAARISATGSEAIAAILSCIPGINIKIAFWGVGGETDFPLGEIFSNAGRATSAAFNIWAQIEEKKGQSASKTASYEWRTDERILQCNQAAHELAHLGKQIIGSLISEQIAHHEYETVKKQIIQSREINDYMHEKFSNEELYIWMQGEISRLYYEYYRFAFDTARKAEKTVKYELMRPELDAQDYIKFNYWDTGRKGLLSGETLYLDIKRLEMAYHENNKREYELTKNISLRQLNPYALLCLKAYGSCEIGLPEWLFDLDSAGHYFRRIKSVSLTIPSITGPYTSVCCTLTLLKSSIRKSSLSENYPRQDSEDTRFIDYYSSIQSIVTSNANNDSGMFETNLRDEKFLPFEGHGVISTWKLELPDKYRQFDYNTISDVILHIRYTARQGGSGLKDNASSNITNILSIANSSGLAMMCSLKHDFPNEWQKFSSSNEPFKTKILRNYFPYYLNESDINIASLTLYAIESSNIAGPISVDIDFKVISENLNNIETKEAEITIAEDDTVMKRNPDRNVFILFKYSASMTLE